MANRFLAWQLWIHYVLLEALILFAISGIAILEPQHIILLYIVIALGDQAIHLILGKATGWKD